MVNKYYTRRQWTSFIIYCKNKNTMADCKVVVTKYIIITQPIPIIHSFGNVYYCEPRRNNFSILLSHECDTLIFMISERYCCRKSL